MNPARAFAQVVSILRIRLDAHERNCRVCTRAPERCELGQALQNTFDTAEREHEQISNPRQAAPG